MAIEKFYPKVFVPYSVKSSFTNIETYSTVGDFPITGAIGVIYIALDTDKTYLWDTTTSAYVEVSSITPVIDNLTSTSTTSALSANQGRILNETKLSNIVEDLTPQLGGDLDTNLHDIKFLDNDKAIFGTGLDAEIYVDSNDDLNIRSLTQDKDIFISVNNGGGDTELMRFKGANSRLGIFTSSPVFEFQSSATENGYLRYTNVTQQGPNVFFARSRGTESVPTIVQNGDKLGTFAFLGYDGVGFSTVPFATTIIGYVDGTPTAGSIPARIEFATQPVGGTTAPKVRKVIRSSGLIEFKQTAGAPEAATALYEEKDTTPANPTQDTEVKQYMKDDKFIWQFNNGGTVRYFYIDLTATAAQQVQHTTTAP